MNHERTVRLLAVIVPARFAPCCCDALRAGSMMSIWGRPAAICWIASGAAVTFRLDQAKGGPCEGGRR